MADENLPLPWHHVHITHADRTGVAAWYATHLGAVRGEPTKRSENLWYGTNLLQVQSDSGIRPGGEIDHIGLGVPQLDGAIDAVVSNGGTRLEGNLVMDAFGTRIGLMESDDWCFHHVEIVAPEPLRAAAWYAANFGGEVTSCPWRGDKPAIRYDTAWLVFGAGKPGPALPGRPICHYGWYTPNMEQTADRMTGNGCRFPVPPRPFGAVQIAFVEDPTGLWIELVELPGGIPK